MKSLLVFLLCTGWAAPLYAATWSVSSGSEQVSLVELYCSEGVQECLEANTWLSQFENHAGLWKKFVPLQFSVTYWDEKIWNSFLSSEIYDKRLEHYSKFWNQSTVSVPSLILNGNRLENPEAFQPEMGPVRSVGILSAKALDGEEYLAAYQFPPESKAIWLAHGVLLGFGIESPVRGGQNIGRVLKHDFYVMSYGQKELKMGNDPARVTGVVRLSRKASAAQASHAGVVFWVTRKGSLVPEQAVGGYLSDRSEAGG